MASGALDEIDRFLDENVGRPSRRSQRPMNAATSPHPEEQDIHLRVTLAGEPLDFAACLTSALCFLHEQRRGQYFDSVDVVPGSATGLARLPNERLYDGL